MALWLRGGDAWCTELMFGNGKIERMFEKNEIRAGLPPSRDPLPLRSEGIKKSRPTWAGSLAVTNGGGVCGLLCL